MRRNSVVSDGMLQTTSHSVAALAFRLRRKAATVVLVALTIPIAYTAFFGTHGWLAYHQELVDSQKLESNIHDLQARNEKVKDNIKALKTEPKAIEREAREQLHYARPDDVVISVPPPLQKRTATESAAKR